MKQEQFFDVIKKALNIKKEAEFKSQIAGLLNISESGAYKKIKSITHLTLEEMYMICDQINYKIEYNIESNGVKNHPFVFNCDDLVVPPSTYEQWASNIFNHSLQLNNLRPNYKVYSYQSDISYFHLFPFKHLLYFKLYAWNRAAWKIPTSEKFEVASFKRNFALNSLSDKIYDHYLSYEAVEIWHVDFINGLLSQIKYYTQLNIFGNKGDLILIIDDLKKLVSHLEKLSEVGFKREFAKKKNKSKLDIYLNYTHTSSSLMLIKSPQLKMIYNLFLHPNYIRTSDEHVCKYAETWIDNIITQSELISGSGELARNLFFENINQKVSALENELNL